MSQGARGVTLEAQEGPPERGERQRSRVLFVDDDPLERRLVQAIFAAVPDLEVELVSDGEAALASALRGGIDVVLLDRRLPTMDGLEVLTRLRTLCPSVPVVMLTGDPDVKAAARSIQLGAYHFLAKPVDRDELILTVRNALERTSLVRQLDALQRRVRDGSALSSLLGTSAPVQALLRQIQQVGPSNFTVLIHGETGAGKEVVARAIHETSERAARPMVAIDCGAIPESLIESELFGYERGAFSGADKRKEGLFHVADGGTLFLDEVGNLPLATQAKLLRVLQERKVLPLGATVAREVDVRFLAATNAPLDEAVRAGRFRQDLYYRLAEFTIQVPPLRARGNDILVLARRFLEEATLELRRPITGFGDDVAQLLLEYGWPGNVRQLRNVIRQAVLLSTDFAITAAQIRSLTRDDGRSASQPRSLREISEAAIAEAERRALEEALREAKGNKALAGRMLQVDYKTLHSKLKRYGIRFRE